MRDIEFNNGFVTALALFYGHRERQRYTKMTHDFRLDGAKDHLYDLEYPKKLDKNLKRKIKRFAKHVFQVHYAESFTTTNPERSNEIDKLFEKCASLLKEIDETCFGLKVEIVYP